MVNGNYVLYGDRPSSESEIVDDHVQTRTAERKNRRKSNRTANELQRTLNMAQLDNETDAVKCEKKIKEPRLLRYVSTSDVEENFVNEKFETYDLKPTEERPRRYAFQKKPKNPADGSVNYAHSRSNSSCSSPNGNLPTISEHGEQYGTYRVRPTSSPTAVDIIKDYEPKSKLEKYFTKPKEDKGFAANVTYKGSHPDSLYRVPTSGGVEGDRMARVLRVLRWPVALVAVCIALAVFVYFLMPDNLERGLMAANGTYWEPVAASASYGGRGKKHNANEKPGAVSHAHGTKTPEIDFYDADNEKIDVVPIIDTVTETNQRKLPIEPVFPKNITPEVQYGNEQADSEKLRTAKVLNEAQLISQDSTLKPHITQKPEKPLAVYFKEANIEATTTEKVNQAETINKFVNYGVKQTTETLRDVPKNYEHISRELVFREKPLSVKQFLVPEPEIPTEVQEFYSRQPVKVNFTSGHSNLFGISIEDAERMMSTTQNSLYNTRVSPTLPTWRDRDDATTKNYPVNVNYEVPQCRSTRQHVCRGILPYDLAGSPMTIAGVEATALLPQMEYLVATNCSDRVKHFVCALMEPECSPPLHPPKMPCYNLCKAIVDSCDGLIPRELTPAFKCGQYSRTNCVGAKSPCYDREFTCKDHSCIPREWLCDGSRDCPNGEDETSCDVCEKNEYRCKSGGCILKRWLCDGYTDCPGGEDETDGCDHHVAGELGEESAGSALAVAVRRPNKLPGDLRRTGETDSSKELLITSESSNALKRNFTRRPSQSRLSPYSKTVTRTTAQNSDPITKTVQAARKFVNRHKPKIPEPSQSSQEDVDAADLGFIENGNETAKEQLIRLRSKPGTEDTTTTDASSHTKLEKFINKLEKVIDGVTMLQKVAAGVETVYSSSEFNGNGTFDKEDTPPPLPQHGQKGPDSVQCSIGELRCVDGKCIALAQLCDGTIDCTDHADEDNCYT